MTSPTSITKTYVTGITPTGRKLQDACLHLRGSKEVWMVFFPVRICNDCGRYLKGM